MDLFNGAAGRCGTAPRQDWRRVAVGARVVGYRGDTPPAGEVFSEAAAMLTTFVLLGHWFEMRARGGANEAIRTLMELARTYDGGARDGNPSRCPTAEVKAGDLLLIRPGAARCPSTAPSKDGHSEVDEVMVTGVEPARDEGSRLSG